MNQDQEFQKLWEEKFKIHSYEIDIKGNATLPVLCKLMQESASNHAEHLQVGYDFLKEQNLIWVISRQLIHIYSYPRWGDTITVHTWPSGKGRMYWQRDFKILNQQNAVIGVATTIWFTVDLETRKPRKTEDFFTLDVEDAEQVFPYKLEKLNDIEKSDFSKTSEVSYFDLDIHAHVNNVRYIEWILESFSYDFQKGYSLKEIEINFLSEARVGEGVTVCCEEKGELTFLHNIVNNRNGRELCRAKTKWDYN